MRMPGTALTVTTFCFISPLKVIKMDTYENVETSHAS